MGGAVAVVLVGAVVVVEAAETAETGSPTMERPIRLGGLTRRGRLLPDAAAARVLERAA
ncbi:hypothetical protein GOHSU_68_00150 [Gordonia hirsuta DSM 44140 = NBRC 16056]|uniref:Uncharacterized protein n=1 Tax=Gordonia hirsuta DSM 44140 = NBRC 16056 TaxID=1121927 RepID=L7LG49_9ACTN|nr:hypothetical protein GOHSU_68_00150 [Gordonia hirsuta DSM 44140 = NBRC 16056]